MHTYKEDSNRGQGVTAPVLSAEPWEARMHELIKTGGPARSSRLPALPVLEDAEEAEEPVLGLL
jgi:hypothetical protein